MKKFILTIILTTFPFFSSLIGGEKTYTRDTLPIPLGYGPGGDFSYGGGFGGFGVYVGNTRVLGVDNTKTSFTHMFGTHFTHARRGSRAWAPQAITDGWYASMQDETFNSETSWIHPIRANLPPNITIRFSGTDNVNQSHDHYTHILAEPMFSGNSLGLATEYTEKTNNATLGKLVFSDASYKGVEIKSIVVRFTELDEGALSLISNLRIYRDDNLSGSWDTGDKLLHSSGITTVATTNSFTIDPSTATYNDVADGDVQYLVVADVDPTGHVRQKRLSLEVRYSEITNESLQHGYAGVWTNSTDYLNNNISMIDAELGLHRIGVQAMYVPASLIQKPTTNDYLLGAFGVTSDKADHFDSITIKFSGIVSNDPTKDVSDLIGVISLYGDEDEDLKPDTGDLLLTQQIGPITNETITFNFDKQLIAGQRKFYYLTLTMRPDVTTIDKTTTISYSFKPTDLSINDVGNVASIIYNTPDNIIYGSQLSFRPPDPEPEVETEQPETTDTGVQTVTVNSGLTNDDDDSYSDDIKGATIGSLLALGLTLIDQGERTNIYDKDKLEATHLLETHQGTRPSHLKGRK